MGWSRSSVQLDCEHWSKHAATSNEEKHALVMEISSTLGVLLWAFGASLLLPYNDLGTAALESGGRAICALL
eukprot:4570518-Amphidinium_carterae.1